MKPFLRVLGLVALSSFLTGCIESTTLLSVKKDGSGTIVVREYYSPEIMSMLEGFQDTARGMEMTYEDEEGVTQTMDVDVEGPENLFEEQIQNKLREFGPGVTFTTSREIANDRGWQGYKAIYAFADINEIRMGSGEMTDADDSMHYTFEFTPGDTATLRIIPVPAETVAGASGMDPAEGDMFPVADMEDMDEMDMDMFGGMESMFGSMFAGMRLSILLQVEGEIAESNADYPATGRNNAIALMDLDFDRFLDNPEAMQLLMAEDPDAIYKLKEQNVPGIRVEDPDKTITIRFR